MRTESTSANTYTYDHVTTGLLCSDMSFGKDAPSPGARIPAFDLPMLDGGRFSTRECSERRPLLLMTGSASCPMTASANPMIKEMYEEFGQDIDFLLVQVREAHPGEHREQPRSDERKREYARDMQQRDGLPWPIAIDDVDGSVHRLFDEKPNALWLTDRNGTIVYRSLWAGDDKGLTQALDAVFRGVTPHEQNSARQFGPMAMGIGKMGEVTKRSGPRAQRDMWRAAPPMAAMAWLANVYQPLPPKWRTIAALGTIAAAFGLVVGATRALRRSTAELNPQLATTRFPHRERDWDAHDDRH